MDLALELDMDMCKAMVLGMELLNHLLVMVSSMATDMGMDMDID